MTERQENAGACLLTITLFAYGLLQFWAGYIGVEYHLGGGWATGAIAAALLLRFTVPISIGAFFGAMDVWGWHWAAALAFSAPGLVLMTLWIIGAVAKKE